MRGADVTQESLFTVAKLADFVPANHPLRSIRELADEKARAERARKRFEARNDRLERELLEREAELDRQKESAKAAGPAAIAEILKRKQSLETETRSEVRASRCTALVSQDQRSIHDAAGSRRACTGGPGSCLVLRAGIHF